jgi:two-component sensor histidine kinase/CheY-like chemotaxis protein
MQAKSTILIIDKLRENRKLYRQYLQKNSASIYTIAEFESATQALIYCQEKAPDLILVDFELPDATVINFLEELKRQSCMTCVPVVVLSALGDETIAVQVMKSGAQDYLVKNRLTREALNRAANTVMERVRLMRQIEQHQQNIQQRTIELEKANILLRSEITERMRIENELRQSEAKIRRSLEEKETLLKEIHHRVKNNLQIISSLLRMQSRRPLDETTFMLFQESQNRVQSMALIHEHLYQNSDLSQVDFGDYIRSLADNLFRCYGISQRLIYIDIETNALKLSLDTAIPCGLIINELVSNSLKYAFLNKQSGKIIIYLQKDSDSSLRLTVGDSGIGIPENIDWQSTKSLGLRIVHNLTRQLKGTISLERNCGTTFHINFPKLEKN